MGRLKGIAKWLLDTNDRFTSWLSGQLYKFNIRFDNTQTRWSFTAILLSAAVFFLAMPPTFQIHGVWAVMLFIVGIIILMLVGSLSVSFLRKPIVDDIVVKRIDVLESSLTKELRAINTSLVEINRTLQQMNEKLDNQ